ncbi:9481_t:CDS:1, partial [Gigaspora rosea]
MDVRHMSSMMMNDDRRENKILPVKSNSNKDKLNKSKAVEAG